MCKARPLTSQIAYEVLQQHLAVWLDVGAVHVSVEKDDGKGQDEDGVRVMKLLHHIRVAHTVPLAEGSRREKKKTFSDKKWKKIKVISRYMEKLGYKNTWILI